MSDPIAKAERSRRKDLRQGVTAQRERPPAKRKVVAKPFAVWGRYIGLGTRDRWFRAKRFVTRQECDAYIEKEQRSGLGAHRLFYVQEPGMRRP